MKRIHASLSGTATGQDDRQTELWQFPDGRRLRITIRIDHGVPHQGFGRAELWHETGGEWREVWTRPGVELGDDKDRAARDLRAIALQVILRRPEAAA